VSSSSKDTFILPKLLRERGDSILHNVLVANRLEDKALERLKSKANVTVFMGDATLENPAFKEALQKTEGITGLDLTIDAELLQHAPNLKIISNVSVGYNNLDLDLMTKYNIMRTNTPIILIVNGLDLTIDAELLQHAPNLKIISNVSVGYNNLDLDLMTKHNIMGTNTPGVLTDTVADLGFALLMASARRLPELDHYVKNGKWNN